MFDRSYNGNVSIAMGTHLPLPLTVMTEQHQLEDTRDKLRAQGNYLPDVDLLDFEWVRDPFKSRCYHLVACEDLEHPFADPAPVVLSLIVRLSDRLFYMTPGAGWDHEEAWRPNRPSKFEDAKATAMAEDPGFDSLTGEFEAGWDNLAGLFQAFYPEDPERYRQSGGAINWKYSRGSASHGFQIRHKLFEVGANSVLKLFFESDLVPQTHQTHFRRESRKKQKGEQKEDFQFRVEDWPVQDPKAREELLRLRHTHVLRPIPARDVADRPILPTEYKSKLQGAVVLLKLTLAHWAIPGKGDFFNADVEDIEVIIPSPSSLTTPSPSRKRVAKVDDFDDDDLPAPPSPLKRRKVKEEPK
jgi:hypothetical protein